MITVHHLNSSRSLRIVWFLEELGVQYELVAYQRDKESMLAPESLRNVHPLGKAPVITDGDVTLAESGAILEYLAERYGQGNFVPPAGSQARLRYTYWMHYAEGSAMPPLLMKLIFRRVSDGPMPFFIKPIARAIAGKVNKAFIGPQLKLHFDYMEAQMEGRQWFAGDDFSAADAQMSFPLEGAAARGVLDASRPNLMGFLQRIHDRPAYKRALERAGSDSPLSGA